MRHVLLALGFAAATSHAATCPPAADLQALKSGRWSGAKPELVLSLTDCLSSPDPILRDELGYGGLFAMLRGRMVDTPTVQQLRVQLLPMLSEPDPQGFRRPFAALSLAEVARVDRLQPFLSAQERQQLVDAAATYLAGVRDYRGYDEREGWRHGVAHGADLMLQLSLNPQLTRAQADAMLAAIAAQIAPPGAQAYRYGEGERLMAPVFYLARRGLLSPAEWEAWLMAIASRVKGGAEQTQATLADRHNVTAFLSGLYVAVRESGNADVEAALLPGLRKAIKAVG